MNSLDYKSAWKTISENDNIALSNDELDSLLSNQSKESGNQLERYLTFDLILKVTTLIALAITIIFFSSTYHVIPLVVMFLVGTGFSLYECRLLKNPNLYDFTQPTQVLISTILVNTRRTISKLGLLVSITNPLIIVAGSYLYFYNKYGTGLVQSTEDITVTLVLMFIGFMINYVAFTVQQNSQLNDLEISNHVLITNDNSGLKSIVKRRKRRLAITFSLMALGFIIFLVLFLGYNIIS